MQKYTLRNSLCRRFTVPLNKKHAHSVTSMILAKALRIRQSRKNSKVLWGMHHIACKALNMDVN